MDRFLDVRTPESIAFSYELAGLGSRALAVIIDLIVQLVLATLLVLGIAYLGTHAPKTPPSFDAALAVGIRFWENVILGLVLFAFFTIFFGYFILFEGLWNGQTPGKKLMGIRVVRDGGYPIDLMASLIRNLVRVGEWLIGGYAIAAISALVSPENKRIGDIAAGTIVVRDHRMDAPKALLEDLREEPTYASTLYLSGEERAIVRRFLDRRDALASEARAKLAAQIADRVRPRLPPDLARLDDESLLERL